MDWRHLQPDATAPIIAQDALDEDLKDRRVPPLEILSLPKRRLGFLASTTETETFNTLLLVCQDQEDMAYQVRQRARRCITSTMML